MKQESLEKILQSPRLPSLPTIALEVTNLVQQDAGMGQIAETLRHDPALSSKILKAANSPLYGQSRTVDSINRALVVLGLGAAKTLALGFTLVSDLKEARGAGFDHTGFWRRSLYTATAANVLSQHFKAARREEAFLGGLLQDLGMVAMSQALGDEYGAIAHQAGHDHTLLCTLERDTFDVDHPEVGAALAEQWNLPPMLVAPIRHHERPEDADEEPVQSLVRSVALGNRVAELFLSPDDGGGALQVYHEQLSEWFEAASDPADPMLSEIYRQTDEMARLFDLPTGPQGNPDDILARANEALTHMTLETHQHNRQLADEAMTDSLTGLQNRRAFDEFGTETFRSATTSLPASVLFVDVDHFKMFNDVHGHAVGDRVLTVLGTTLREAIGDRGKAFRYGGEEFAVVCPRADATAAVMAAEDARRAVEQRARVRERGNDHELRITCSIGVATHDSVAFDSFESWIKAADQGVYAAKSAGRNCVRTAPAPSYVG